MPCSTSGTGHALQAGAAGRKVSCPWHATFQGLASKTAMVTAVLLLLLMLFN